MMAPLPRLSREALARLVPGVRRPSYDPSTIAPGIVHLGVGAFHRAHQAVYVEDALEAGEHGWGIVAASLRQVDTRNALAPQDGLYTLAVKSAEGETLRVIGALRRIIVAPEDPSMLLAAMADPAIRIVTLTVTEKGYCHDPSTGELNEDHPDIRADLATPRRPRSATGFLVEALRLRRASGVAPFTVVTCDNLPANGRTVRKVVSRQARLVDPDLGAFVAGEVAFPSTMVDRIVPATTDADRDGVSRRLGAADAWPVVTEPFTQWVIEDHFPQGRPRFEDFGAELVRDVAPYETMKLRLLNASHSTLAYLGYLAGHETIADAMADEAFARLAWNLMNEEMAPTLSLPSGADVESYKRSLLERFRNPALRHRTWQIAMDGSQKLPQRLLAAARERLAQGAPIPCISLGVAAWMRYVSGTDETGALIDVRDPLAARLRALADGAGQDARQLAASLLGVPEVFGDDLAQDERFAGPVTANLALLLRIGAKEAVRRTA
jgi:fructuronate reductase